METSQIISLITKWSTSCGEEWTVAHLKDYKLMKLHQLAGSNFKPNHWIATSQNGNAKGPIKALFRISSKKKLSKALTLLSIYSAFVSKVFTDKQKMKFFSSMESLDETGLDSLPHVFPKTRFSEKPGHPPTIIEYCVKSTQAPGPDGKTVPERDIIGAFLHGARSNAVRAIVAQHEEYFEKVIPCDAFFNVQPHEYSKVSSHNLGNISLIQEPGYKARCIANPSRVLQAALEPLKHDLEIMLRKLKTDCTHDQLAGVKYIQSWLKEGRTVYSVDLSDATNLFPWPYQKAILDKVFVHPDHKIMIDIMDRCATGPWKTHLKDGSPEVTFFSRGQPLGLGPSFHTFALAHNTLLAGICHKHKLEPSFRILGDDVAIGNQKLHDIYRSTLINLGCKVSESKTFISDKMAEFAGYTILPTTYGRGFKWKGVDDRSFLDVVKNLGPSGLGYLDKTQREIAKVFLRATRGAGGLSRSDSSLDDLFLAIALSKPDMKKVQPFGDLISESVKFLNKIPGDPLLATLAMKGSDFRKITLSEHWNSPRIREAEEFLQQNPNRVFPKSGVAYPDLLPYQYPLTRKEGDPRPSIVPFLQRLIEESGWDSTLPVMRHINEMIIRNHSQRLTHVQKMKSVDPQVTPTPPDPPNMVKEKKRGMSL